MNIDSAATAGEKLSNSLLGLGRRGNIGMENGAAVGLSGSLAIDKSWTGGEKM